MTFDNCLIPLAVHGQFGPLSPGKANSHSTALSIFLSPFPVCSDFLFPSTGREAYSFVGGGGGGGSSSSSWVQG